MSPAEYLERERRADGKSEYYSGEISAMAGASRTHNLIAGNVFASLTTQLRDKPCEVYANDMRVQSRNQSQYSYPDVVAVCTAPEFLDFHEDNLVNPQLIVEVLSPSTEAFDRGEKFARYRLLDSLTDYLLVAQDARRIEHFAKQSDDGWTLREATGVDSSLTLSSIGCILTIADVYNKVRVEPPVRLVLDEPR